MNERIEKILVKFLMNAANTDDLEILTDWLKKEKNRQIFTSYVKINYAIDIDMNEFGFEKAKKEYLRKIREDKSVFYKYKLYKVLKYAAVAVIIFGLGYFFQHGVISDEIETTPVIVNTVIETGTDKATLTLGDGSTIALEKGKSFQKNNAESNGEEIVYSQAKKKKSEVEYHYLTVPRGGEYFVKLPDGTQVWLNSESQLKYPEIFIEGETRQVELIYGEAYFEVSPSTGHNGAKFKVFNQSQEIEVLGTEFNIKAYKDETSIYTTLVEGKVAVRFDGDEKQNLTPSQQSKWNPNTKQFSIGTVNVYNEISWKYGVFSFDGKPLKEIVKILSRWYNVDFVILDKTIEDIEFIGVLRKNKKLEDIILNIKNFGVIKDYKINDKNKTIILK